MKKIITSLLLACAITAGAQTDNTPNRMLVNSDFQYTGYAVDAVDSITFARVDGDVRADVTLQKYATGESGDTVWVNVKRTPSCEGFSIDVISSVMANRYKTDADIARLFRVNNSPKYYEDFTSGQMTGFPTSFEPGASYTVVTMGYDRYGVACQASRAEFTVPAAKIVGNPTVTYTIDDLQPTAFTLTVTPNFDCKAFYWCEFEAGQAEAQFQQWGPIFGFNTIGDMIKSFSGQAYNKAATNTWDGLMPKSDYEVYVLPTDVNGNPGNMVIIPVTTKAMGGTGTATVDITVGNFGGSQLDGGFWQELTFIPNDQAGIHHDLLMTKDYFDANFTDDAIADSLTKDVNPFNPYDTNWNSTGIDAGRWNAQPSTAYYAFSRAQNVNGEYGPLAKVAFTTPASASGAKANKPAKGIATRINVAPSVKKTAVAPSAANRQVRLVQE